VSINEWYARCEVDNFPAPVNSATWNTYNQNPVPAPAPAPVQNAVPVSAASNGSSQNFFVNEIYANPKFIEEIDSSIPKLSGDLKAKAELVKSAPTAVWLAWEGAPGEVAQHLEAAGSKTVVFIMYMIPTRDCNSLASAGGAASLDTYKGYVNDISNTIKKYPNSKVVMVIEPDTLGNLVTGTSESCKTVHGMHKNALSYAVDVFGSMNNVSVYLDAAHGKWLGEVTDKVAAVIKEILNNAPNGKIRGLSTNISNYQPVYSEYEYHKKLAASLAAVGVPDMKFIVDTGRNGVDITEAFSKTETWCNFVGTGFGERPRGNPSSSMPLLDAYMWLKTPGEADGSSTGSRADPVCARPDSLPGSPDAGQWFHDYLVQLLTNANPGFESQSSAPAPAPAQNPVPVQNQAPIQNQAPNQYPAPAPANAIGNGSSQNFFVNEIYANPKFIEEIDSSIPKLSGDLKAKAELVKSAPTAVWLAWEGAPGEVAQHLEAAGSKTVVFIMYMIPTRDCNSLASAGGAASLDTYKGYVNDISNTIKKYPNSKVVMVIEPDTLGNLVTGTSESCKTVHGMHKNALSYAVDVFGSMNNVSVYLDAAHGKWLGEVTDKVAAVIKEILNNAPNGKIRGLSTNISNYQPVYSEYEYHKKLAASLAAVGVPDMKFIVDTGRNGVDITEAFSKTETWCNFVGTGFGERPRGNPSSSMPLLDAYMWLKTPGEADGSSTGSRADPVCARPDSLPGSPDAGQWFHDYFVQLLTNANPGF